MAKLITREKDGSTSQNKSRVYFTCHPDDFDRYFDQLCDDIFAICDCAIYYTADMDAALNKTNIEFDIPLMNIIILPVTKRLLTDSRRALTVDLVYAKEKNIPILPLLMEDGLEGLYQESDSLSDWEFLPFYNKDLSEPNRLIILNGILYSGDYLKKHKVKENKIAVLKLDMDNDGVPESAANTSNSNIRGVSPEDKKKIEELEAHYKKMLESRGEEHPDTLTALSNLGYIYSETRDYKSAISLQKRAYELRCKVIGPDHESTITSLSNLAITYYKLGQTDEAIELMHKVCDGQAKKLGKAHPTTIQSMINLAIIYRSKENYEASHELIEKIYALRKKSLGKEHPDTISALRDLSYSYRHLKIYNKFLEYTKELYDLQCKVLGKEHPSTLISLSNLACAYLVVGDKKASLSLYQKLYDIRCRILGEEHPSTVKVRKIIIKITKNL